MSGAVTSSMQRRHHVIGRRNRAEDGVSAVTHEPGTVTDDLPHAIPVTVHELEVIETFLTDLIDEFLFRPMTPDDPAEN